MNTFVAENSLKSIFLGKVDCTLGIAWKPSFNDGWFYADDFVIFRPKIMWGGDIEIWVIFDIEEFNYITKAFAISL